ncbi:MAG: hypothetical protein AAFQ94_00545 [Bacteroidota bacterium]
MTKAEKKKTHASRNAIERIYINMRHLFNRGKYKPTGMSGESLMQSLLILQPEIYGHIAHKEKVELDGLLYILERLPDGIEECRFIKLIAREGFMEIGQTPIIPPKRRRNCYRIDEDRMYVEMTRGRSDIYDILTHLTFMYNESEKIKNKCIDSKGRLLGDWLKLEEIVSKENRNLEFDEQKAIVYLSNILGRTVENVRLAVEKFKDSKIKNSLFHITYWLGKKAIMDAINEEGREITFSAKLREIVGQHVYGEKWADNIKKLLCDKGWFNRPVHIISANLHSFQNAIYGFALPETKKYDSIEALAAATAKPENKHINDKIKKFALANGMYELEDNSGTNLTVQVIDLSHAGDFRNIYDLKNDENAPILIVMDYAFGEQAYECMDELLKPYEDEKDEIVYLNISSITIMGKAGILAGEKGDVMLPNAHVFEGTADNYPFENELKIADFTGSGLDVYDGTMVTVLGTSLQNRDVLNHFMTSTWNATGLEMEGAHYHKAIQSAAKIRKSISDQIKVMYAYYASDNPLKTGNTLASGSLGVEGIIPTYMISTKVLQKIFNF